MKRISVVRLVLGLGVCFLTFGGLSAQSTKDMLADFIDENANTYETVAQEIWSWQKWAIWKMNRVRCCKACFVLLAST